MPRIRKKHRSMLKYFFTLNESNAMLIPTFIDVAAIPVKTFDTREVRQLRHMYISNIYNNLGVRQDGKITKLGRRRRRARR